MNKIRLSICITTRNRADFIGETVESILSQANDQIEIVIVDGASTDNTPEIVKGYQQRFGNLVYYCSETNHGVDLDMAKAIELARGDYCWLFSDDDMLKPGSIPRMLREIETGCEIYLCNITACDLRMRPIRKRYLLDKGVNSKVFALHDKNELIEYCDNAISLCALFSYWCAIVFRRQEWNKTGFLEEFDGSAYASASVLLSFIKRKCRLKYIRDSLVLWRSDNVSFQHEGGLVNRFLLDFNGYLMLADKYFSADSKARASFLKVMTREHPWYTIVNVTSYINNADQWRSFRAKMLKFGYSARLADVCYILSRLKPLVLWGVKIKRTIVNLPQLQRSCSDN